VIIINFLILCSIFIDKKINFFLIMKMAPGILFRSWIVIMFVEPFPNWDPVQLLMLGLKLQQVHSLWLSEVKAYRFSWTKWRKSKGLDRCMYLTTNLDAMQYAIVSLLTRVTTIPHFFVGSHQTNTIETSYDFKSSFIMCEFIHV